MPTTTSSSQLPAAGWGQHCQPALREVNFGSIRTRVHTDAHFAFRALSDMFAREYGRSISYAGAYGCRQVAGTSSWSYHSYGLAIDIDPHLNPWRAPLATVIPRSLRDMSRIRTLKNNLDVFTWGGVWRRPDAMHYQIRVYKSDLASGIKTPYGNYFPSSAQVIPPPIVIPSTEVNVAKIPSVKKGDKGANVQRAQGLLLAAGFGPANLVGSNGKPDGIFGAGTESIVKTFQAKVAIQVTGVVSTPTWNKLLGV